MSKQKDRVRRFIGKAIVCIVIIATTLSVAFFLGPRSEVDPTLKPIVLPADLDAYLLKAEARFSDIVPGSEKTIVWANEDKSKTDTAIVYLHGFSASRQETAPLSDELATELGANLYYTRYTGHGRTGSALAEASVNDWLNDTYEALQIGQALGNHVIVIGSSTGGTLATWLAEQTGSDETVTFVLLSPNFRLKDATSEVLTWPWARQLAPLLLGAEYSWEPVNREHGMYWNSNYPTTALITMMSLVKFVRETDFEKIKRPILVIHSPHDKVVNSEETERRFAQFGSEEKELIQIDQNINAGNHILAGDILAPNHTDTIKTIILTFIAKVNQADPSSKP